MKVLFVQSKKDSNLRKKHNTSDESRNWTTEIGVGINDYRLKKLRLL